MKAITKKKIKEYVRTKLMTDILWIKKALLLVYSNQTKEEQVLSRTVNYNGVGFTGVDSEFLSSLAKQLQKKVDYLVDIECLPLNTAIAQSDLSIKQTDILKKKMSKYWQQVVNSCDEDKLFQLIEKKVA